MGVPFRIRTRNLLPRSEQHRLVPQLSLLRSVDRFEHELAVVHLLGRLGVEGDSVHNWFEILREELSEEGDFVEVRRHDLGGKGEHDRMVIGLGLSSHGVVIRIKVVYGRVSLFQSIFS